jgi:hypothetical protein
VISPKVKVAIIKLFPPGGQCETFVGVTSVFIAAKHEASIYSIAFIHDGVRIKSSLPFIFMDGAEV